MNEKLFTLLKAHDILFHTVLKIADAKVRMLIEIGADPNYRPNDGEHTLTLLEKAVLASDFIVVKLLLANNACPFRYPIELLSDLN